MDPRRLVVGVIRVVRAATGRRGVRADGGARGVSTKNTKNTKKPRQLFRFQFQRQLKGFCTESSPNIYTLTLVNGSVWAAGTRPLRLIESLAVDGRRGGRGRRRVGECVVFSVTDVSDVIDDIDDIDLGKSDPVADVVSLLYAVGVVVGAVYGVWGSSGPLGAVVAGDVERVWAGVYQVGAVGGDEA